jgi:hypothetical protein
MDSSVGHSCAHAAQPQHPLTHLARAGWELSRRIDHLRTGDCAVEHGEIPTRLLQQSPAPRTASATRSLHCADAARGSEISSSQFGEGLMMPLTALKEFPRSFDWNAEVKAWQQIVGPHPEQPCRHRTAGPVCPHQLLPPSLARPLDPTHEALPHAEDAVPPNAAERPPPVRSSQGNTDLRGVAARHAANGSRRGPGLGFAWI